MYYITLQNIRMSYCDTKMTPLESEAKFVKKNMNIVNNMNKYKTKTI